MNGRPFRCGDDRRRDRPVVGEELALRDPLVGPEHLVQVRQAEHALALPDLVLDRELTAHVIRRFVLAQPQVNRRAQVPVVRPLGELHLGDQLRGHPDDVFLAHPRQLRDLGERRGLALEGPQLAEQPIDFGVGEPRADVADVRELPAALDGEHERAETARAPALPLRVPRDHELLAAGELDLQPFAAALPDRVAGVGLLRHDALEALCLRRLEQRLAVDESL